MRCLIVEDDLTARELLRYYLRSYAECSMAANGLEAVEAVESSLEAEQPYDLICLDIMMPRMNGQEALTAIRKMEKDRGAKRENGAKVIMTTAMDDSDNVKKAFETGCQAYIVKPVGRKRLYSEMEKLGLMAQAS
ncbi:MAG: response regulator [Sedimentisphaerales bacterium]|nr:response regulator [Sedimentisphaerales bacterium]